MRRLECLLHLSKARIDSALAAADRALELDPAAAASHHTRGLALTAARRIPEADVAFSQAAELDPRAYFRPYRLDASDFDRSIDETLASLPEEFQRYLENVEVAVEETPSARLIRQGLDFDLLGLYQGGTIQAEEWGLPDRILLFQRNIENVSPDRRTLLREMGATVLHEVGHHMGMEEHHLEEIEAHWEEEGI